MENSGDAAPILKRINKLLTRYGEFTDPSTGRATVMMVTSLATAMSEAVLQLAPLGSSYGGRVDFLIRTHGIDNVFVLERLAGVLHALRTAYSEGYLLTVSDIIQADVFADFLEMAAHLLETGYKDPSAVLVGATLEEHLRKLCTKARIEVENEGKPKKADRMNADLAQRGAYNKLDQKSVTAWLELRNNAAHGKFNEYTSEQVTEMLTGVRNFISRTQVLLLAP